jgi:DNA-binding NarL/FixJ family response regulator
VRAVVVEDQPLLREVMVEALTSRGVDVVGRAGDRAGAVEVIGAVEPDVALLDIRLPPAFGDEGIRVAEQVRRTSPGVGLLVLSSFADGAFAERLLGMPGGARGLGYLLKDRVGDLDRLTDAMRRVAAGEVVVDPAVVEHLMAARRAGDPLDRLTPHERRVLGLVAEGRSNLGIAQRLGCRTSSVEKHLTAIVDKLGLPAAGDAERPGVNVRVLAALAHLRRTAASPVDAG